MSLELKVGMVGGLISSVLVLIFIQPIKYFVWTAVLYFGEYVQAGYVDRIYRGAALGDRNIVGHLSALVILMVMLFVAGGFLGVGRHLRQDLVGKLFRVFVRIVQVSSIFIPAAMIVVISISGGVMEITASFNQRLAVIAPAISDKETKEWKAKLAMMHGQNDYRALVSAMEKRAKELQIELPKLREP